MAKKLNVQIGNYDVRGTGLHENFMQKVHSYPFIMEYARKASSGLDIQLRGKSINIYFEGGSLLELSGLSSVTLDENYFYQPSKIEIRMTDLKRLCYEDYLSKIGKSKALKGLKDNLTLLEQKREEAQKILADIKGQRDGVIQKLKSCSTYEETAEILEQIKSVMHNWKANLVKNDIRKTVDGERLVQHYISLFNKDTNEDSDFVVLDIEFAVSTNAPYAKENEREKQPRIDIVAIEKKTGQLYVMELKYGMDSVTGEASAEKHYKDYVQSVGKEGKYQSFIEDIQKLLEAKKREGIISESIFLSDKKPIFAFIMKCREESDTESFKNHLKEQHLEDIPTIYLSIEKDYTNPAASTHILKLS